MSKCPNTILLSIKKKTVIAGVHGSRHFEQGGGGGSRKVIQKKEGFQSNYHLITKIGSANVFL